MENLLRRAILNRNQLVTKKRKQTAQDVRKKWREYGRMKNVQDSEMNRIIQNERIARREDWMLGPLAPQRDVGTRSETYGAVDNVLGQGAKLPTKNFNFPRSRGYDAMGSEDQRMPGFEDGNWRGEGLTGNLVVGDRVVVVKGRLGVKGKIGEVIRIDKDSETVFVKNVNKADMRVPPQAIVNSNGTKVFEQELPILISDVRLVTTMIDPRTGMEKDVIVRQVVGREPYVQRSDGSTLPRHTRYIKGGVTGDGEDIAIAWPKDDPDRFFTQGCDTSRRDVEEVTWRFPTLFEDMPSSIIDELRSKHSRSRRDFDDLNMMHKKLLEDARRDWFKERSEVLSQPFWGKRSLMVEKAELAKEKKRLAREERQLEKERRQQENDLRLSASSQQQSQIL